jgi:glucokinase
MANPLYFVGVDVGGTTMKGGVVDETGQALSAVTLATEAARGQELGLERMCETVRQAVAAAELRLDQVVAIGVATPGTMDIPAGIILDPPNLKPWQNVPVQKHIHETFGVPTAFQNDGNAAAFGEYWAGVGRGTHSMVLFTLGTGIGCGIIIQDVLLEGRHSHGAEVGHIRIDVSNPRQCPCGRAGCLEAYASASAVVKRTLEALNIDGGRSSLHGVLRARGDLTSREIFEAAASGDSLAGKIVEDTAFFLAVGATNMMHTIDPDMVVFGGGMIAAGDTFLERIRRHVHAMAFPVPAEQTRICFAQLGTDAGFIGAAGCARRFYLGKEQRIIN